MNKNLHQRPRSLKSRFLKSRTTFTLLVAFAFLACLSNIPSLTPVTKVSADDPAAVIFVAGNPSCATLNADDTNFPSITSDFGYKLDSYPANGSYPFTNPPGELTGGAPEDSGKSVTITQVALPLGEGFDWTSTVGINAVIVKGGPNADAYVYTPAAFFGDDLHAPVNPANDKFFDISHLEFCYGSGGGGGGTPQGTLNIIKFYDANANGDFDLGDQLIPGWLVNVRDGVNLNTLTPAGLILPPDDYVITEGTPTQTNWVATTPNPVNIALADGETENVEFGNLCLGAGGGRTLGFWSNKNGETLMNDDGGVSSELSLLSGLCLVGGSSLPFDPSNYKEFRAWILSANATNMAYMLSAQLAAMELNVEAGSVNGSALVYAPCLIGTGTAGVNSLGFISINDLMAAAAASLCADPTTVAAGPARTYQECLKTALDQANNNLNFVQSQPCQFSFPVPE